MSLTSINFATDLAPDILKKMNFLSRDQLNDVDFIQAIFHVAHEQGVNLMQSGETPGDALRREYTGLKTPQQRVEKTNELIERYQLNRSAISDYAQMFSVGHRAQNAPYFADTLVVLGHLKEQNKDAILTAQYGAKAAHMMQQFSNGTLSTTLDEALAMREPRADESPNLRAAQHVQKMGTVLAAAIRENPHLAESTKVKEALTAVKLLAGQSMKRAAEMSKGTEMAPAIAQMKFIRSMQRGSVDILSKHAATSTLVGKLEAGIAEAAQQISASDPNRASQMTEVMGKTKGEIKQLKVFGSKLLPKGLMSTPNVPASFVDRENERRNQGQVQNSGPGY